RGDELLLGKRGLVVAGDEVAHGARPGPGGAPDDDAGVQREQQRGEVHVRVGVGEVAADAGDVADADVGHEVSGGGERGRGPGRQRRAGEPGECDHRADAEHAWAGTGDPAQRAGHGPQAHQPRWPEEAVPGQERQGGASRERPHGLVVTAAQLGYRVRDRGREYNGGGGAHTTASGSIMEPVAPVIFSGAAMKRNSYTWSRASSSR